MGPDEAGDANTQNKRLKKRSEVWDGHFTEKYIGDERRALCNYCDKNFSLTSSTTTHLTRHLIKEHICSKVPHEGISKPSISAETNERVVTDQPASTACENINEAGNLGNEVIRNVGSARESPTTVFGSEVRHSCLTQEVDREIHVKNAILVDLPFLSPNVRKAWSSPMGMDMEKEICTYYQRERDKLLAEFERLTSRICFSIKIMEKAGWVSITAHFINSDFNLVKKLIGFKKLPADASLNLDKAATDIVDNCISDWKLETKIFSFTTESYDFNSSLKKKFASKMLSDCCEMWFVCLKKRIGYLYSILLKMNLCDGINNIMKLVVDGVQGYLDEFSEIVEGKGLPPIDEDWLKGWPIAIEWDADSSHSTDFWKICSTIVKMFKDTLPYKEVIAQCSDESYTKILLTGMASEVKRYEAMNHIIEQMSNFKYPTSNLCFQADEKLCFLCRFNGLEFVDCRDIICVACVFDPRYKLIFLKYYYKRRNLDYGQVYSTLMFLGKLLPLYAEEQTNQDSPISPGDAYESPLDTIGKFSLHLKELKTSGMFEMEQYLAEEPIDTEDTNFDVLRWWRENRSRYPTLSRMARDVLAIPACVYSVEENLNIDLAVLQGVSPEVVEAAICSKDWILSDVPSSREFFQNRNEQKLSTFATANDSGEKTGNADSAQHASSIEIPRDTSPNAPFPNKISEAVISISGNSQEADIPQPTLQKQLRESAPDEDEEKTKAAMQQVREKNRGKFFNWAKYSLGLNLEEFLAVEVLEEIEPIVVIVKMESDPDNPIRLTRKHMNSLLSYFHKDDEERWIVNQVIDAYINIINHERDPSRNKALIVSTLDTRLLREGIRKKCKTTKKIRELGMKFLKNDLIFFPINMGDVHWIVGALNITKLEFQILDSNVMNYNSVSQSTYDFVTCELCPGIGDCIDSVRGSSEAMQARANQFDKAMRNINVIKTVPQQTDQSSCGLFALRYIQFWNGSDIPNMLVFPTWEMDVFRRKVAAELIMSELNLMKVVQEEIKQLANEVVL